MEDRFKAIWFAACGFLPSTPESQIAAVKIATSKNICSADGNPRLNTLLSIFLERVKSLICVTKALDCSLLYNKNQR